MDMEVAILKAIRIRTRLGPGIFQIPELKSLIGKNIEIIIIEEGTAVPSSEHKPEVQTFGDVIKNPPVDMDAFEKIVNPEGHRPDLQALVDAAANPPIDLDALEKLRNNSMI